MDTMELLAKFADPETLQTLTATERLMAGLVTTLLGMGITFVALVVLQFVIGLMARFTAEKTPPVETASPTLATVADDDSAVYQRIKDEQLVAAITVALAMQLKTATSNIVVRNIRKIEDHTPVWNRVGLAEQMNNNS